MKKEKITDEEREELRAEGELPPKATRKREDRQLLWFVIVIGVVFASFLIPYFYRQSSMSFEFAKANWTIEDYDKIRIYHGRFMSLAGENLIFNSYLRIDPRKNDVASSGTFNKFKYGGVISVSPEVDECRGDIARVMGDLGLFLGQGVGVGPIEVGSTDETVAVDFDKRHATCETILDRTLVVIESGESRVTQDDENPYCYMIYIEDCNDISPVEKFMVKTIDDFGPTKETEGE